MASKTTLIHCRVQAEALQNPVHCQTGIQDATTALEKHGFIKLTGGQPVLKAEHGIMVSFFTDNGSSALLRTFPRGLITLDITEFVDEGCTPYFSEEVLDMIANKVKDAFGSEKILRLPAITRGGPFNRYLPAVNGDLIEYDFDSCVYEADSPYQNIKIMHSPQFGNMLLLDDDPNLAESDLSYTHAITGYGREDMAGKEVLVLGGGDGGILHEVLKQKPKFITLVDIDGMVVEAAKKHLRGICYDSLDALEGENYKVIVADCIPYLEKYHSDGKLFDYVINDLTAIPCTETPIGDQWDFLRMILSMSMKVLSPTGKYFTQGNGVNAKPALAMYEQQLAKLEEPVDFSTEVITVPSYMERWVFYEIWKKAGSKRIS